LNCDDVTRRLTAGELIGEVEPVINVVDVGSDRASEIKPLRPGVCRDAVINSDRAPVAGHLESDDNRAPEDEKDRVSETASSSNFRRELFSNSDIDALDTSNVDSNPDGDIVLRFESDSSGDSSRNLPAGCEHVQCLVDALPADLSAEQGQHAIDFIISHSDQFSKSDI
jgi:hypothetical protein